MANITDTTEVVAEKLWRKQVKTERKNKNVFCKLTAFRLYHQLKFIDMNLLLHQLFHPF